MTSIRPASTVDVPRLQEIEVAAGQAFREVGLPEIADDDPPSAERLAGYLADERAWVATVEDRVVGYVLVDVVDGRAHVEQVSVHPEVGGRGIGRALLDHVSGWAAARAMDAVTLTTFGEVPWNAPYYERLGFRALDATEIGPELAALQRHETEAGLDPVRRVAMRRDVS